MANITLAPEVLAVLTRSTVNGNVLILPPVQLERKLYESVNKVIVFAGGKWKRGIGHVFPSDPMKKLGIALETGIAVDHKKKLQAFFTPEPLARRLADIADVSGHIVLEPSAGHGSIADACIGAGAKAVHCIEIDPENCDVLRKRGHGHNTVCYDFLAMKLEPHERIVMNPPFTKNQDIAHVAHALKFLQPSGILVAVMSPAVTRPKFQAIIADRNYEIEELPAGAFKESGTSIATIILTIRPTR